MRVPSAGPKTAERRRTLARLRSALAEVERIPAHRREAQCADVREKSIRKTIDELENGYEPIDLDDPLDEIFADSPHHQIMKRHRSASTGDGDN